MIVRQVEQCMTQYRPKNPPGLANSERLKNHCEELRELVQIFEHQVSAYLPGDSVAAEHRFEMGELPAEMVESCARLFKLTDALRGLAEFVLNDLTEQTGKHDIVRLHRSIIQMSRTLGYLEAMSKLWRLAALDKSSNAPISNGSRASCAITSPIFTCTASASASATSWRSCCGARYRTWWSPRPRCVR